MNQNELGFEILLISNLANTSYIYKKIIQAKHSTYGSLYFLETGLNLLQIHLVLDFPKSE